MSIMDLFRPKWKHSDPIVRRKAVQELKTDEVEILEAMAASDEDIDVRVEAIRGTWSGL